ncbi:MAG: HD-GYP domain-containing protein [Acidobacteria bacterium]|nr:HD-GYP domain-containing protein [Acidobacteriota bacterium]
MRRKDLFSITAPLWDRIRYHKRSYYPPVRFAGRRELPETILQTRLEELKRAARRSGKPQIEIFRSIATAIDEKDLYTRGHSERVTRFSVEIAKVLAVPEDEIERIRIGALIHDIGKLMIDSRILNKPSPLTSSEYEVMKTHTTSGYEMLKHIPQMEDILPGAQSHHEKLDGSGYPQGLRGDEIPKIARIITVADCFDAMTTTRPYRNSTPVELALRIIRSKAGIKFDGSVVEALHEAVGSGRIAMRLEDRIQARHGNLS